MRALSLCYKMLKLVRGERGYLSNRTRHRSRPVPHIVCLVDVEPDRAVFTWSEGPAAFRPFTLDRIVYKASTVLGLAEAAAAGIGLVLLPCFIGSSTPGLVQLATPDPELEAGLWLLTHPDLRHTARVRAFMDFAGAEIAKRRIKLEGGDRTTRDVA